MTEEFPHSDPGRQETPGTPEEGHFTELQAVVGEAVGRLVVPLSEEHEIQAPGAATPDEAGVEEALVSGKKEAATSQAKSKPESQTPKTPAGRRGHPMKQVKRNLAQQGKLNAKKPMPPEQRRARRKKGKRKGK